MWLPGTIRWVQKLRLRRTDERMPWGWALGSLIPFGKLPATRRLLKMGSDLKTNECALSFESKFSLLRMQKMQCASIAWRYSRKVVREG